jgi:CHAT domain-containing protein
MVARRWIAASAILTSLLAAMPTQAVAQEERAQLLKDAENVGLLIRAGRNLDAIDLVKRTAEAAPPSERQAIYQVAASVCMVTYDVDCARDVLTAAFPFMESLPQSQWDRSTAGYNLLLGLFLQIMTGDYQSPAQFLDSSSIVRAATSVRDPVLFAELHLLAAKRSRLVSDFEASRDHLDKALVSTLSLRLQGFEAHRLIVRIAGQLLENDDIERALRLVAAAEPLLQTIPPDSLLAYDYLQLRAALHGYHKDFASASKDLHLALAKLERLQLREPLKSAMRSGTYNELLGLEVLRGDQDSARNLLQSHPLMSSKSAILQRGSFANVYEFNFALAEEFVRLITRDTAESGWGDLMKQPARWTTNPRWIEEIQAFGRAAVGLQLLKAGRMDEARDELVAALKMRLATLREQYRKSVYASPLPRWADLVLAEFALASTLGDTKPDYDLIVQAQVLLNRSIETSPDDALTSQAVQASDEGRRVAQALRTMQYQWAGWEQAQLAALAKRAATTDTDNPEALARERQQILYTGANFVVQQQLMRVALSDRPGTSAVESVASLAVVQQLLLADEALVFHVPALDRLGKICIRADQTLSSIQEIDNTATTDARLLRAALTAAHPASVEADSQFPVAEAVRLGKLAFGGLEDCLRRSRRIYLVTSSGPLSEVPPAVLLAEAPPALGAGFDLRAAHWMIRDHAFVRTTSINAFVATKRLSKTRRATLDYLGVGDPVLAPRTAGTPSGGEFAARGSFPVQAGALGSLPELPETAEELERVASLFDKSKARVLSRDAASEESFRLQPLSEFDIIHFATHGLVKEEQLGLKEPSIVLTPDPAGDAFNDGLLTSSQIAALPLRARLVVLSACNSARYAPSIIDSGIQGLATSFAIAGVPSVIASLWPIESSVTRDLITDTFRVAREGDVAIADALATAVRRHLDGPTPRPLLHPRFWAAMVVMGDGSLSLNASTERVARDLGPFFAVNASERATILSASGLDADFVVSAAGGWDGKRFPSSIRRHAADGTTKWEVRDREIGAGPVVSAGHAIYAGGYVTVPGGASTVSVPVLRAIGADGKVSWTRRVQAGAESANVLGLDVAHDGSALALVGPVFGQKTESDFSLVRIDGSGREVARRHIALAAHGQSGNSGYLGIDKAAGLMIVNRDAWIKSGPNSDMMNGLGDMVQCWEGDAADIVLIDVPELAERKRARIDRFRARGAVFVGDGWILVGDGSGDCGRGHRAVAYAVRNDGSVERLWRDTSVFETSGNGIRKIGSAIEIVGYAARLMGIPEQIQAPGAANSGSMRYGNEAYVSGEAFSVRLSDRGVEKRRDFVGAGFPIFPIGMTSANGRGAIYGTIGSRALWMPH